MIMTARLKQFVKEVTEIAMSEPERDNLITYEECITEYTDQIISDDFWWVVNYAYGKGVKIPRALQKVVDLKEVE